MISLLIAALIGIALLPASPADAEEPCAAPNTEVEGYCLDPEELRNSEEQEREEEALELTELSVHAVAHPAKSFEHPGYTELVVTTSPGALISIIVEGPGGFHHKVEQQQRTEGDARYTWSCHHTGPRSYVVRAYGPPGEHLTFTRSGRFETVSDGHCRESLFHKAEEESHKLRIEEEARQRRRKEAEERARRSEERARVEKRRYEERLERERQRSETNCRKLGDKVVDLETRHGPMVYCETPAGELIPVPH